MRGRTTVSPEIVWLVDQFINVEMEPVKRRPECRDAAEESRYDNAQTGADMATRTSWPGAAHPLIRLLVTDITSPNARMIAICAVSP
jgi:hypothetical protein